MKTKLQILIAALFIVFSMAQAFAQQPINPQTGLPEAASPAIDPATGLPANGSPPFTDTNGVPTWVDPAWKGPGKVLKSFSYGPALYGIDDELRKQFDNEFDIIMPSSINPQTGLPDTSVVNSPINLRLQIVRASEIFSAMNLQFELNKSPLRWELTMNGSRPTALLRNLPQLAPPPPAPIRKVFYVGDMLDEYPGTNDTQKLQTISHTIVKASVATGLPEPTINTYPSGQLLIVFGTPDQVDLAEQTVRALKEKAEYENSHTQQQPVKSQ